MKQPKILKIGDLMHLRKPLGSIYKIVAVHEYWIPNDSGAETLTVQPADAENYGFSRIYHYVLYSNASGKILKGSEQSYCKESLAVAFDKELLLNSHKKAIEKLENQAKNGVETAMQIAKIKTQIDQITKNLY